MPGELAGRTAVITGGASGNGRAIALACAREGANVVVADLREEPREGGRATHVEAAERFGIEAAFVRCDVRRPAELAAAVEVAEGFGGVDILVANAGILRKQSLLDLTEADVDGLMDVNLKGVLFAAQAAARRMVTRRRGVIVTMASIAGLRGTGGYALYNASKGAVRLLTSSLADELGPSGIRVVSICPGIIDTHMNVVDDPLIGTSTGERYLEQIPLRRWGGVEEVAEAVVFVASDRASYLTGTSLTIDGGYLRI